VVCVLLAGCVKADFVIELQPDGSGRIDADVAYSSRKWPGLFGDPFASFLTRAGYADLMPPGFVAWAEPEVSAEDGWRHLRTAAYFDDLRRVVLPAHRHGEPYPALRFAGDPRSGEIRLLADLDSILARPLPLPSPDELGMEGVSIPETVMNGIRSQIGTLISGLDLDLVLEAPGELQRADGFDSLTAGRAMIHVDADRGASAFQDRAGVLVDTEALTAGASTWRWNPAPIDSNAIREFRADRAAALSWWQR
jgi:hypothetical protein